MQIIRIKRVMPDKRNYKLKRKLYNWAYVYPYVEITL